MAKQQQPNRKLFAPSLAIHKSKGAFKQASQAAAAAKQVYDMLPPEHKAYFQDAALSKGAKIMDYFGDGSNFGTSNRQSVNPNYKKANPSTNLSVFKDSPVINEGNVNYAISKAPNPKGIKLNSGIKPNAFSNDYMTPMENSCSPLHMTAIQLKVPTAANNPLSSYFTNTICFDIQTRAQANVGFGLDIANKLSATQMTTAFNAAINALQIYFYYSSILSYESNSKNKNSGMIYLRSLIDSQTLSDLTQLGRRLEDVAIPKRVVEWVRYMNGNFLSADTQGAPIIKTTYHPSMCKTGVITPTFPAQALAALSTDNCTTVFSLLRNSIPHWRIGVLYDCNPLPTFDKNFLSIFANLETSNFQAAALSFSNIVSTNTSSVPYNSYSNNLDGLAYAMGGIWNSTANCAIPGIADVVVSDTTNRDSRMSYYTVSGVRSMYNVYAYNFLALSRQETNTYLGTTIHTPHLFGTDKLQNVTGEALLQSGQNTLDYLFNIGSIPISGKLSHFNPRAKQVGRI